ncbi:hypothetical protein ACJJTC_007686 [Scirpophaga incertulas]
MSLGLFRKFFRKENFNFDRSDIDLDIFHPQLKLLILPLGIFFNNNKSKLRIIWPLGNVMMSFVSIGLELMFVLHGITTKDYFFATECFSYFVMMGIVPFIYGSLIINRKDLLILVDEMNNDFIVICAATSHHRKYFLNKQLLIWKLCIAWLMFTATVSLMFTLMALVPLLYLSLFGTQDEHYIRPLIFPVWLPKDDPYKTPNYELFLCFELCCCLIFTQCFPVFVYLQLHALLHICVKLDLIVFNLNAIFEGLDESTASLSQRDERRVATQRTLNERMQRIIKWHVSVFKSIDELSTIIGAPLAYQIVFSSLYVCLIMYQLAVNLEDGVLNIKFLALFFGACLQLGIPCLLGSIIQDKAFAVGDACWQCGWHNSPLGQLLRQDILIVMARAQQPLTIKYTGLPQLSLQTFSSIMNTAYSYFNMLRQYN